MESATVLPSSVKRVNLIECGSREAWIRERSKSIGASDAAAILGASPWRSKLDVYAEKVLALDSIDAGVAPPLVVETEEMEWGTALEDPIAQKFAERTHLIVAAPTPFSLYRPTDLQIAHATPDRFLMKPDRQFVDAESGLLEIKTTAGWKAEEWEDDAPLHVTVQIQAQMFVLGLSWGYVTVLIGGQKMRSFEVQADPSFHELLADEIRRFWKTHVEARNPPEPRSAEDYEAAKRLYRRSHGGEIELPSQYVPDVDALVSAREAKSGAEKLEKQVAARLILAMGTNEIARLPDGRRVKLANEDAFHEAKPAHTVEKRVLRVLKASKKGGAR